jgi:effector-binding domain-containing protein
MAMDAADANAVRIEDLATQQTAALRVREPTTTVDVGRIFGEAMGPLGVRLGEVGATPAGPPFARFHDWGGDVAEIEIGIPLAARPDGLADLAGLPEGEVGASTLPGGETAVIVHRGPYPTLREAYMELLEWIRAQGRKEGSAPWESYVDDPATVQDVATLRTELLWPLARP